MSNSSSNTFSESQLTECPLFALGCCTVENCSGSVTSRDLPDHIFGSKENGTIQLCSLAKQTSYLKAANQVLLEELQALKTESQRVKYVNFLAIKKEKEKGYEKLAALRAKTPPGFVTKKIDGKTTVFSGTVPDADLKHLGILVYQNGAVYHGEMLNFVASGIGIKKYASGASHNGGWQNGTKSGGGTYRSAKGDVLVGNFVNGLTHGKGKWTSADGNSVFDGEFVDDKKHGKGTLKIPGSIYEGEFENDLRHGKGTENYTCGQKYVGDFVGGEKHGYGEYTWPAGELYRHYTGAFADGDLHGYGVLTFSDGRVYRGMFDSDFMHGPGKMKHMDGRMLAGVWRYDIQLTAEEEAKYYAEQKQKLLSATGTAATVDDEDHETPFAGLKLAEHMDGDAMKDKDDKEEEERKEEQGEGDHDSVERWQ